MKLGHVALDGTRVRANASKHNAMSYGRMKEEEQLVAEVGELLRQSEAVDEEEDRRYGQNQRGDELPEELSFREGRWRKIRGVKAALEAEARGAAEQARAIRQRYLSVESGIQDSLIGMKGSLTIRYFDGDHRLKVPIHVPTHHWTRFRGRSIL